MVAVAVLADSEVAAQIRRAAALVGIGDCHRLWCGARIAVDMRRGRSRRLIRANGGFGDGGEHHGERHQDGRKAADPSPEVSKSRHGCVYTPVTVDEQLIMLGRAGRIAACACAMICQAVGHGSEAPEDIAPLCIL